MQTDQWNLVSIVYTIQIQYVTYLPQEIYNIHISSPNKIIGSLESLLKSNPNLKGEHAEASRGFLRQTESHIGAE